MTAHEQGLRGISDARASEAGSAARVPDKSLLSLGSVLAGIGASSCCVIPFTLVSLGTGGAWLSNLTALAPYQPYFLATAFVLLAAGFWRVYRRPAAACAEGTYCAKPVSDRLAKIGLWMGTALVGTAIAFNTVVPLFLDS